MSAAFLQAGMLLAMVAIIAWGYSALRDNVTIVDSLWSLMFLVAASVYLLHADAVSVRNGLIMLLIALWAVRLSVHLAIRNHGQPEDRRYQEIRQNNSPGFRYKSLYIVFGLQALLAWLISTPLLFALESPMPLSVLDMFAIALWMVGFVFETVADWQLHAFQRASANAASVLNRGLWRYSRHPNYFGEFCIWWAFYLFAVSAGGWWTVYAPVLMSILLLRVSGVGLMEKGMSHRRPEYAQYIAETSAFFPAPPRQARVAAER